MAKSSFARKFKNAHFFHSTYWDDCIGLIAQEEETFKKQMSVKEVY